MNNFNLHRFGCLLRADMVTDRKRHITLFLSVFSASLLLLFFSYYKPSLYGWESVAPSRELAEAILTSRANGNFMVLFFVFMTLNLSTTFSHLFTKQQRIAYIMLPASNLEKFLSRLLQHTVFFTFYLLAGICLADLVRMAVFPLFGHAFPSALPRFFSSLFEMFTLSGTSVNGSNNMDFWGILLFFLMSLSGYLVYLAGSALFRRRAFLNTLLVQLGLAILLGVGFSYGGHGFLNPVWGALFTQTVVDLVPLFCLMAFLFCVWCVWWSYWRIARLQVILRHGWFNFKK